MGDEVVPRLREDCANNFFLYMYNCVDLCTERQDKPGVEL